MLAAPSPAALLFPSVASLQERFLPFGDAGFDQLCGGGLPLRGLVELAGEAGSGKTQLAMQLALRSVAVLGGTALIINTEGPFPAARLAQMAAGLPGGGGALVERVHIADVTDAATLQAYVEGLPKAVAQHGTRLVVVDSVAGALRGDLAGGDAPERSQRLFALAAALLRVNAETGCGCVAINQVSDVVEGGAGGAGAAAALAATAAAGTRCVPRLLCAYSAAGARWVRPALGLSWDAACTHRFLMVLSAQSSASASGEQAGGSLRSIYVLSSPSLPPAALSFRIHATGLVSVGGVTAVA
jgi:hypothetical protein